MKIQPQQSTIYTTNRSADVVALSQKLKAHIDTLSSQLTHLLNEPQQSEDPTFLTSVKQTLIALSETSKQINGE